MPRSWLTLIERILKRRRFDPSKYKRTLVHSGPGAPFVRYDEVSYDDQTADETQFTNHLPESPKHFRRRILARAAQVTQLLMIAMGLILCILLPNINTNLSLFLAFATMMEVIAKMVHPQRCCDPH